MIADPLGEPIYFRIFYPGGGIGPDAGTTDNQNVYLVRQAPVTILGTGMPGSSGLIDPTTGLPVQGIQYDAGDPTVYTYETSDGPNSYQYVDNSGGTAATTANNATFVGPSNTAAAGLTPTSIASPTALAAAFNAELGGVGVGNSSEYVLASGGSLNLNNETLSLSYIDGYLPAIGDRITLVQNNTGSAGRVTGHFDNASGSVLVNGSEVYATDQDGNVITDPTGQPIYFRIFYPGGGIGPDGCTTTNQNVYLVRQAPVTILGTGTPGSSGLTDPDTGQPVLDLRYDAGDPRTFDGYQYVDNTGGYQRSLISEITVTFTGIVDNVDASQFSLSLSQDTSQTVGLQVTATQVVGEDTMVTLTFLPNPSDPGLTRQRQLADGELTDYVLADLRNWTFTINAGAVTQYGAHEVDGTPESVAMQNSKVDQFWTLFGDFQGTRHVDATDGAIFSSALSSGPSNAYFTASDYWGNGQALDPSTFTNYGVTLAPPDATPYGTDTPGISQRRSFRRSRSPSAGSWTVWTPASSA